MWDSDAIFLNLLKNIKYPDGTTPTWIWDTEYESYFTQEGSKSVIYSSKFTIEGEIAEKTVPFYFACDNVAAVYVNGDLAGYTGVCFEPYEYQGAWYHPVIPFATDAFRFVGFGANEFNNDNWNHVYKVDIKKFLRNGSNVIRIIAANSIYDPLYNPTGLLFACEFSVNESTGHCK